MSTGETWWLGHRSALDGVRGIAILLVMLGHSTMSGVASAGTVGVTVFFTLSGFLITSLLLQEWRRSGRLDLRAFYLRRARRLMPAMYVALLSSLLLCVWVSGMPSDWSLFVGALTWTTNLRMLDGKWGAGPGHMWSLAIEEQFYLVWPLLLVLLTRLPRRWQLVLLVYGALASLLLRIHLATFEHVASRIYFGTDTRADSLLIGCALAVFMHQRPERQPSRLWSIGGLMIVVLMCFSGIYAEYVLVPCIASLATAAMLWGSAQGTAASWLSISPLTYCGRRSYGYYLFESAIGMAPVFLFGDTLWTRLLLMAPLSWLLAELSWRYVEQPFLRRGARRLPRAVLANAPAV